MSVIKPILEELEELEQEVTRNNQVNKRLRARMSEIKIEISEYLESKNQNGIKYNGRAIIREREKKRPLKKKASKKNDAINVLRQHGMDDAEYIYNSMMDAQRESPSSDYTLKIKKIK